jgi:N-acetylglutamate synthase-like GNAT family acetyltransferase
MTPIADGAFSIQPATQNHLAHIRSLILHSGINPSSLDWRRFLVALTPSGEFIGCGQVKPHKDGSREVASIAVIEEWRGRGVARAIIEALVAANPGQLYLMCESSLGDFYTRFGFQPAEPPLPTYFRRISKLAEAWHRMNKSGARLLIMRRG